MSLFENEEYRWRETYFVLFEERHRPTLEETTDALTGVGSGYKVTEKRVDGGFVDSLTLVSPHDFAGMDISYVSGDEVRAQVEELQSQLNVDDLTDEEQEKLKILPSVNARFDIYHFEQIVFEALDEEDGFMDPGTLLLVLEGLARVASGVGIDPQSDTIV